MPGFTNTESNADETPVVSSVRSAQAAREPPPNIGGIAPVALVQVSEQDFCGVTKAGGNHGEGTFFHLTTRGRMTTVRSFRGGRPERLIHGADGNFYGTTTPDEINAGTFFQIKPDGELTVLHHFGDAGETPSTLIAAADGDFYGSTLGAEGRAGTLFRISPQGRLHTLHSFESVAPTAVNLIQADDGALYGTTAYAPGKAPFGTVFRMIPKKGFTTIHTFSIQGTDGHFPDALVQGADGNLYGTTRRGGRRPPNMLALNFPDALGPGRVIEQLDAFGWGTVFQLRLDGCLTTLHRFEDGPTLTDPRADDNPATWGNITWRPKPSPPRDWRTDRSVLIATADGNLWGVRRSTLDETPSMLTWGLVTPPPEKMRVCEDIFRITPGGEFTMPYTFVEDETLNSLLAAENGDVYGTCERSGRYEKGWIYKLTPNGEATSVYSFGGA